jgi:hypothetical protein
MTFGKRMDVPGGRRASPRQQVVLTGSAVMLDRAQAIIVEEVCSQGAKLRGRNLPQHGEELLVKIGAMEVFGSVAWSCGDSCGISFDEPLDQQTVRHMKVEGRLGGVVAIV